MDRDWKLGENSWRWLEDGEKWLGIVDGLLKMVEKWMEEVGSCNLVEVNESKIPENKI